MEDLETVSPDVEPGELIYLTFDDLEHRFIAATMAIGAYLADTPMVCWDDDPDLTAMELAMATMSAIGVVAPDLKAESVQAVLADFRARRSFVLADLEDS